MAHGAGGSSPLTHPKPLRLVWRRNALTQFDDFAAGSRPTTSDPGRAYCRQHILHSLFEAPEERQCLPPDDPLAPTSNPGPRAGTKFVSSLVESAVGWDVADVVTSVTDNPRGLKGRSLADTQANLHEGLTRDENKADAPQAKRREFCDKRDLRGPTGQRSPRKQNSASQKDDLVSFNGLHLAKQFFSGSGQERSTKKAQARL